MILSLRLISLLLFTFLVFSGAVVQAERFLRNRFPWLCALTRAVEVRCISRAQLPRLLARVEWEPLNTLILAHLGVSLETSAAGEWIAIDGKALRGSPGEQVVLARTHQRGRILAQQPLVGPKASEVTAVRTLLAHPPLPGCKVTLDALHCNPRTTAQIEQAQGGYLVQVKAVKSLFSCKPIRLRTRHCGEAGPQV